MVLPEEIGDAAQNAEKDRVMAWLDAGGSINDFDEFGFTLLHCCAFGTIGHHVVAGAHVALARQLIALGADVTLCGKRKLARDQTPRRRRPQIRYVQEVRESPTSRRPGRPRPRPARQAVDGRLRPQLPRAARRQRSRVARPRVLARDELVIINNIAYSTASHCFTCAWMAAFASATDF